VVDKRTLENATEWRDFNNHMQQIQAPAACPGLPPRTMPALDVFFKESDYVNWFNYEQEKYKAARQKWAITDKNLKKAINDYNIQKAKRDTQYCDWKAELEEACREFDHCYETRSDHYNKVVVPRVTRDMDQRIENYKAGETLVHQIKFLLAEVAVQETPAIDTSRYEILFPTLPPKGKCDLSVLDSSFWVPVVDCPGRFCLRIVTGTSKHDDGDLEVDWGNGAMLGGRYSKGETVTDACHDRPIHAIHVQAGSTNAWSGSVEYSSDAGESFHPMSCTAGCNMVGSSSNIVVDGNQDGEILADLQCLNKARCTLENARLA